MLSMKLSEQTAAALMLCLQLCKQTTTAVMTSACSRFGHEHRATDQQREHNHHIRNISTHLQSPVRTSNQHRQIPSQINGDPVPRS
jgi:hypothetical protein